MPQTWTTAGLQHAHKIFRMLVAHKVSKWLCRQDVRSVITTDALPSALLFCKDQARNLAKMQKYRFRQKHRTAGHCGLSRRFHHLCLKARLRRPSKVELHIQCLPQLSTHLRLGAPERWCNTKNHKAQRALARCAGTQMHIWGEACVHSNQTKKPRPTCSAPQAGSSGGLQNKMLQLNTSESSQA